MNQNNQHNHNTNHNLYPAILTDSVRTAQEQIDFITKTPVVQIDIIDGIFADNVTITPLDLPQLDFGSLQVDLHLMCEEPLDFLYEAAEIKESTKIRAVLGQIEHMSHQVDFLQTAKGNGWMAGLSLDLYTPLDEILDAAWADLDCIQLMGIEAGFQGRSLSPLIFEKITALQAEITQRNARSKRTDQPIEIIIDGGIKAAHVKALTTAAQPASISLAVGSDIWQSSNPTEHINTYLTALEATVED